MLSLADLHHYVCASLSIAVEEIGNVQSALGCQIRVKRLHSAYTTALVS